MASMWARHAQVVHDCFDAADEARFGAGGRLSDASYQARLVPETNNLRAAMGWLMRQVMGKVKARAGDPALASALSLASASVWMLIESARLQEALHWMETLAPQVSAAAEPAVAARFWMRLGMLSNGSRLPQAEADAAAARAVRLYREIGPPCRLHQALYALGWTKAVHGDTDEGFALIDELERLEAPDWPVQYRGNRLNLQGRTLTHARRYPEALAAHQARYELLQSEPGEIGRFGSARANLCDASNRMHDYEQTLRWTRQWLGAAGTRGTGSESLLLIHAMHAQSRLGLVADATESIRRGLPLWRRNSQLRLKCGEIALVLAKIGRMADAARLDGVAEAFNYDCDTVLREINIEARERTAKLLAEAALAEEDLARWRHEGAALDDNGIGALLSRVGNRLCKRHVFGPAGKRSAAFGGSRSCPAPTHTLTCQDKASARSRA